MTSDKQEARKASWNACLAASPGNLDLEIPASRITGTIPDELRGGRMLSNGPGWNRIGDINLHPFDGHGYVRAFDFLPDGSVRLKARFVETPSYLAEAKAQRLVVRGFATNLGPHFWQNIGRAKPRNVANTTIVRFRDRLLAGWEGGAPYALDPDTLETRGEELFGGAIEGQVTLAHFHADCSKDRLVLCSLQAGRNTELTFREIDQKTESVVATNQALIEGTLFAHDFAISPHWYIVGGNPLRVDLLEFAKMKAGASTLLHCIATDETKPGTLVLIARDGSSPMRTVRLPKGSWIVHFGGAFERGDELYVDACVLHQFPFGQEFGYTGPSTPFDPALPEARGPQRVYRIKIRPDSDEATWEQLTPFGVDFPRIHPAHEGRETPALFGATRGNVRYSDPFDSVIRVDLQDRRNPSALWTAADNVFVGEPIFVPFADQAEEGCVLAILYDGLAQCSTLCVFDALTLENGPIARVPLPLLPYAFHGDWDPKRPVG